MAGRNIYSKTIPGRGSESLLSAYGLNVAGSSPQQKPAASDVSTQRSTARL